MLTTLSADFNKTWSKIDACCEQTQSNFVHTWSLINNVETTLTQCCAQTQSNFEFTWSLIEHLHFNCDLTEVLTTLSADFEHTWSLINACCEQTQSNFEHTWSLINACCEETQSLIAECCEQTQSNFEHTWSLINNVETTLTQCCAQTQSNFEFTWSLIEHLRVTVSADFTEVLTTLSADFEHTWSLINACCEETQSLIAECCEETHSLIIDCCIQTQNNFEHTWSLINNVETTLTECCAQTQSNFQTTFSLIKDLKETVTDCCAALTTALGSGTDQIVSFSCTTTSINDLDVSAISLLKTLLLQSCENSCWLLSIDETGSSLNDFIQTDGLWTTNGVDITTTATPFLINALQYKYLQPAYQVLQVEISFPNSQPPNVNNAVVGGLLFYWTGSDQSVAGPLTCYFDFNTDSNGQVVPGSSHVALEVFRSGGGAGSISYPILLDTYYQMTIIISPYNIMSVYINDALIAQTNTTTSWSGQVLGGYVGFIGSIWYSKL